MTASTVTSDQFRADFPEFSDATVYPDARVQFYLSLAQTRLDPLRWDDLWSYGVELYTAHSLAVAKMRTAPTLGGGAPGATQGVVSSKSVGGVSKSMNLEIVTTPGAGTFNLTSYGSEYYQLVQTIGIGGLQVGADLCEPTALDGYGYYGAGAGMFF